MAGQGVFQARIKSVLSGDTVVLSSINNPKSERTLSLAYVSAPRLRREGDEPFAFASRDFLRRTLVGRVTHFKVLYTIPTTKREYGIIMLPQPTAHKFPDFAVAEGWVRLRDDAGRKDDSEESTLLLERLQVAEARAKADSKGLWAETGGRIDCSYELSDPKSFADQNKGKSLDGVVEKVLSGDRIISRLIVSPTEHVQTMVLIAGIRAPSTKRVNASDGQAQAAEPHGDASQFFVEERLLQRNVKVDVLGVSPQGQIVATIKHPTQGTIAPHILKAGLARCTDFHSTMLGSDMGTLRQAEKAARDGKTGLFQDLAPTKTVVGGESDAVVSRILSADTIFLRNKAGVEKRVSLSSVRQPKPSDPKQAPWGAEAKEFLRKRLIGKHVKCQTNGKRAATEGYEEREMATVSQGGKNIAMLLVENGYTSVIRHRADDTDRSPIYDDLLLAEQQAQEQEKGMWGAKPPTIKNYVDYSASLEKAKRQLALLSRQKKVPAIVDFVKSGSRFTVLVPREDAKLTFVLSGIRAPRSARNPNEQGEPFGQEAHDFANRRTLQRDVEIDVEENDKVGGFIGSLYINRENLAKLLVEEGLASVHAYSAERSGNATELFAAEKKAKEARKGIWHDWNPADDEEVDQTQQNGSSNGITATNGDAQVARKQDYRDVVITHIDETGRLKLQQIGKGTAALSELMSAFRTFHLNKANANPLPQPPKTGDVVAAKFSADGDWYRAKIRRNDREKKVAEVVYLDYGNSETVPWSNLRSLGQDKFNLSVLKPQATEATLSFCQLPGNPEYLSDGVAWLAQQTDGKQLVANVDHVDSTGVLSVTLFDAKTSESVEDSLNAELVTEGWAMVPRKMKPWERPEAKVLESLKAKEKEAQDERRGMWEYGDISADD